MPRGPLTIHVPRMTTVMAPQWERPPRTHSACVGWCCSQWISRCGVGADIRAAAQTRALVGVITRSAFVKSSSLSLCRCGADKVALTLHPQAASSHCRLCDALHSRPSRMAMAAFQHRVSRDRTWPCTWARGDSSVSQTRSARRSSLFPEPKTRQSTAAIAPVMEKGRSPCMSPHACEQSSV